MDTLPDVMRGAADGWRQHVPALAVVSSALFSNDTVRLVIASLLSSAVGAAIIAYTTLSRLDERVLQDERDIAAMKAEIKQLDTKDNANSMSNAQQDTIIALRNQLRDQQYEEQKKQIEAMKAELRAHEQEDKRGLK